MKKILLFIEGLGSGGAERQLSGLAVLLKERGYDVTVLYYADKHFYTSYLQDNDVIYDYKAELLNKYLRPLRLAKYIKRYKPDLVISYLQSCNMAVCIARMFVSFHLIVSERNTNQGVRKKDKILFNLYRLANHVVPNSHAQANFISTNFSFLEKKIIVITNFVDTDFFRPCYEKQKNEVLRVLTVARITKQKNCLAYLDAIKQIKEKSSIPFHAYWFGNGYNNGYEKSVRQRIIDNNIGDVFEFHPASTEIVKEYQSADIFCLPSLYEGYPNTICEAMSCGLPISCGRVCDNPRIVKDGENGFLFNPTSIDDISAAILMIINLANEQRTEMSEKNRARAVNLFSRETFVNNYIDVIESIKK